MLRRLVRHLRHRWFDPATLRRTITPALRARLLQHIQQCEHGHTGQIRIVIESGLPTTYLWRRATMPALVRQRALALFGKLQVWDTEHNNGVLVYLLLAERAIEIVADRGLDRQLSAADWQAILQPMQLAFRAGHYEQGLQAGLNALASQLRHHFPRPADQSQANELPDAPVMDPASE